MSKIPQEIEFKQLRTEEDEEDSEEEEKGEEKKQRHKDWTDANLSLTEASEAYDTIYEPDAVAYRRPRISIEFNYPLTVTVKVSASHKANHWTFGELFKFVARQYSAIYHAENTMQDPFTKVDRLSPPSHFDHAWYT